MDTTPISPQRSVTSLMEEKSLPDQVYFQIECAVVNIDALANLITFDVSLMFLWTPPGLDSSSIPTIGDAMSIEDKNDDDAPIMNEFSKSLVVPEWSPQPTFFNLKSKTIMEESFFVNQHTGANACLLNWILEVSETLELQRFPYDRQILKVCFQLPTVNVVPCPSIADKTFVVPSAFQDDQMTAIVDIGNWDIEDAKLSTTTYGTGVALLTEVELELHITRDPTYYLWNIILVIFMLVLAAFSVVGIAYQQLSERMSITMTLLLTIVAFKFVIASYVPPTPYLTLLDKYLLSAFILMGVVVLENFIVAYTMKESDQVENADAAFALLMSVLWILFHIFVVVGTHFDWFLLDWEKVKEVDEASYDETAIGKNAEDMKTTHGGDVFSRTSKSRSRSSRNGSESSLRRRSSSSSNKNLVPTDDVELISSKDGGSCGTSM